jgi:hypothetical protein
MTQTRETHKMKKIKQIKIIPWHGCILIMNEDTVMKEVVKCDTEGRNLGSETVGRRRDTDMLGC